jgi:Xaa-Pro aminopeptidase
MVLIDAAAASDRYCCDVTRTYPAGSALTPQQRDLYNLVRNVEQHAVARCVAGAEFVDVHVAACREVAEGLTALGLLNGAVDALLERRAHELFFPHGLGHLVGLGVRDASGSFPGRKPGRRPEAGVLRMDLPLEPGYVLTIEPGIYFIPALLEDPARRSLLGDAVRWSALDRWKDQGGVRIEDNVLVTANGPEVLTAAIPT